MGISLSDKINELSNNDVYKNLFFKVLKVKLKLDFNNDLFVKDLDQKPVDKYKAVVNLENQEVFSVVTNKYDLIPNREAFKEGKRLFEKLTDISGSGLSPYKVVSSKRRTFCHVDFVNQKDEPIKFKYDRWLPFLRVTNSYNKTYLLRYEIGFVRSLCSNGLIFDDETIVLKKAHVINDEYKIEASVNPERFRELKNSFINTLEGLYKFSVPKEYVLPLVQKVLDLTYQTKNKIKAIRQKAIEQKKRFDNKVLDLRDQYYEQLEPTAYAVLNILTDLISHQKYGVIPNYSGRESGLQKKIYDWARSFPNEITQKDFTWENYL